MMESGIFEDVRVNGDATDTSMSSLADALASAAATERNNRQRKVLVESIARLLFDTLGSSESNPHESQNLVQQILGGEESASTTIANSLSMANPLTKITLKQNNAFKVHWSWQTSQDCGTATESSTCYLSIFAPGGATIDFFAPPSTPSYGDERLKIAVCEVSDFQWTLEGSPVKEGHKIQSFWKVSSASFSWISGYLGEIPAEEVLLEGQEISLTGTIDPDTEDNHNILRLEPKSILSLTMSSVGSLGLNDKEIRRVGMALRSLVNFLDQKLSVPDLHLALKHINRNNAKSDAASGNIEDDVTDSDNNIPPFDQDGDNSSLGGAMRYYLKHYCNGSDQKKGTSVFLQQPSKLLQMVDFASLKDSVAQVAENKEKYASAAGEAAEAAAFAGKKIANRGGALVGSFWNSAKESLGTRKPQQQRQQEEEQHQAVTAATTTTTSSGGGGGGDGLPFKFGENFRKAVARGKEATDRVVAAGGTILAGEEISESTTLVETQSTTRASRTGGFSFGDRFRKVVAHGKEATGRMVANRVVVVGGGGGGEQQTLRQEQHEDSEGLRFKGFSKGMFASMMQTSDSETPPSLAEQMQDLPRQEKEEQQEQDQQQEQQQQR